VFKLLYEDCDTDIFKGVLIRYAAEK